MNGHNELWDSILTGERRHRFLRDEVVAHVTDELRQLQDRVDQLTHTLELHMTTAPQHEDMIKGD